MNGTMYEIGSMGSVDLNKTHYHSGEGTQQMFNPHQIKDPKLLTNSTMNQDGMGGMGNHHYVS